MKLMKLMKLQTSGKKKPPDIKISPPPSSSSYTPSVTILSKIILVISLFYVLTYQKWTQKLEIYSVLKMHIYQHYVKQSFST